MIEGFACCMCHTPITLRNFIIMMGSNLRGHTMKNSQISIIFVFFSAIVPFACKTKDHAHLYIDSPKMCKANPIVLYSENGIQISKKSKTLGENEQANMTMMCLKNIDVFKRFLT